RANDLKQFQIRIGNESIAKFYESTKGGSEEEDDVVQNWADAKPFDKNNVCFEHHSTSGSEGFFSVAMKKQNMVQKTVKCQVHENLMNMKIRFYNLHFILIT